MALDTKEFRALSDLYKFKNESLWFAKPLCNSKDFGFGLKSYNHRVSLFIDKNADWS